MTEPTDPDEQRWFARSAGPEAQPDAPARIGNPMALASLLVGIPAVLLFWLRVNADTVPVGALLGVVAIIFGAIGLGKAVHAGADKQLAIAGFVMGIVGLVTSVGWWLISLFGAIGTV